MILGQKTIRYIQPIGFVSLLVHFMLHKFPWAIAAFWLGILFTVVGTVIEWASYSRTPKKQRTQVAWVFSLGIVVKFMLIASIALRVYDVQYSVFILLGSIVVSFLWFILSLFIKPKINHNSEILDSE